MRVDRGAVKQRIADACRGRPEVVAAYLFGSALGEMRPDSDIDAGVILSTDPSLDNQQSFRRELHLEVDLAADLGRYETHPFDVTVFSAEHAVFVVHALQDAELAYVADDDSLADFLERVALLNWRDRDRYLAALAEVNGWDPRPIRSG